MKIKFLVTPVGLMMGNIESARRLKDALTKEGLEVTSDREAEDFDILHVHTPIPPSNFGVVKRARERGVPVVMHAHTTAEDSVGTWTGSGVLSGVTGMYLTRFYNLGDLVLAPSAWTRDMLSARGVRTPVRVLSNGVDLGRFKFDAERRSRFRQRYRISEDALVAYSIGVICLKKGIVTFPEVSRSLPGVSFVWTGKRSKLYHPMKVSMAMRRCGHNTLFLHNVEDILDAHCGGDVFFTPSLAENQGMAVMEAMSVGRPVVARDLPSYRGLLTDGETALLGQGSKEFSSHIHALHEDPDLRLRLVSSAKGVIASHDISQVAKQLKSIYDDILKGRSGVSS